MADDSSLRVRTGIECWDLSGIGTRYRAIVLVDLANGREQFYADTCWVADESGALERATEMAVRIRQHIAQLGAP